MSLKSIDVITIEGHHYTRCVHFGIDGTDKVVWYNGNSTIDHTDLERWYTRSNNLKTLLE